MRWEKDGTLILTTLEEISAIETGLQDEHTFSTLEDDLVHAQEVHIPMSKEGTRVIPRSDPEFRFTSDNTQDAKEALAATIALRGFKGLATRATSKKRKARFVLEALARTEEFFV